MSLPRYGRDQMGRAGAGGWCLARLLRLLLALAHLVVLAPAAVALDAVVVAPELDRIDVTAKGELYEGRGDSFQIETAASAGRMGIRAVSPGSSPNWLAFALTNSSDRPIERWITAERYALIGSGAIWPDLDARRIEAITPSIGYLPERVKSDRADIFRITLEPGQTITYVAELASARPTRVYVWKALDYELKARDRQLFNGIMLGITGVLGVFLTSIFAANHKSIFPSAALVAWCTLGYLCVDFGFFHKLFNLRPEDNAVYRAATESAVAASLVVFLYAFLRLGSWHGFIRMLVGVWIVAQLALVGLAVIDPRLASTFARLSFLAIGGLGGLLTLFLALRGQDRALSLVPTWMLLAVWIFAATVTLLGRLSGEVVVSALTGGLVLIVVLIGFTVTQFAFRGQDTVGGAPARAGQAGALAIDGAGAAVWEWNPRRDEVKSGGAVEAILGLAAGDLSCKTDDFVRHMHAGDRERFRALLLGIQDRGQGTLRAEFRMRHADNTYRWFDLEAAITGGSGESRVVRCIGLMRDVTEAKRAHERLVHNAVWDSLTGLPNRALFEDRLATALKQMATAPGRAPTVLLIDIDRFHTANKSFGVLVGDSLLLTVARRIARHLGPDDTLARVGGDRFAIMVVSEIATDENAREIAGLAERIRRSIRAPIKIVGQDVVLTGSIGISVHAGDPAARQDMLNEAETAMHRAKREGADRIEIYRPEMRSEPDERADRQRELASAVTGSQVRATYRPIVHLPTEEVAGFAVRLVWAHPRAGEIDPTVVVGEDEAEALPAALAARLVQDAAEQVLRWQKELPRPDRPMFASLDLGRLDVLRADVVQEIRKEVGRSAMPRGALRIEIAEALALRNPEQASEIIGQLKTVGCDVVIAGFGTGYTSLPVMQLLPVDLVKIDCGIIQSGADDAAGTAILRTAAAAAHELGRKVVADGVEHEDDAGFLRSLGCAFASGFYFGEATGEREALHLVKLMRKSERKLQSRGFFRTRQHRKSRRGRRSEEAVPGAPATAAAAAAAASTGGAGAPSVPDRARTLPATVVRQRGEAAAKASPAPPPGAPAAPAPAQAVSAPAAAPLQSPSLPPTTAPPSVPPVPPSLPLGQPERAPPHVNGPGQPPAAGEVLPVSRPMAPPVMAVRPPPPDAQRAPATVPLPPHPVPHLAPPLPPVPAGAPPVIREHVLPPASPPVLPAVAAAPLPGGDLPFLPVANGPAPPLPGMLPVPPAVEAAGGSPLPIGVPTSVAGLAPPPDPAPSSPVGDLMDGLAPLPFDRPPSEPLPPPPPPPPPPPYAPGAVAPVSIANGAGTMPREERRAAPLRPLPPAAPPPRRLALPEVPEVPSRPSAPPPRAAAPAAAPPMPAGKKLPPAIARSLARLASGADDDREAGGPSGSGKSSGG